MSIKLRVFVAKYSKLKGFAKTVFLQIAHYANHDGTGAYPSVLTLARDCGISESTVHRALRKSLESGELNIKYNRGRNWTNLYQINLRKIGSACDRKTAGLSAPITQVVTPPAILTPKGSSLRSEQYSSLTKTISYASAESAEAGLRQTFGETGLTAIPVGTAASKKSDRIATLRPRRWKNGCARCLKHDCSGCPNVMTDVELNENFDAAVRDSLDVGKPGPAQVASEAALRNSYANWRPFSDSHPPPSIEQEHVAKESANAEWEDYERQLQRRLRISPRSQEAG
jgi:hypothetical protein